MEINHWNGVVAVALAILCFYVTTYAVIALNVGWRFGYWLASASFGALMVLLSIFWTVNVRTDQAVGPQGALPHWIPVAAAEEVRQATFEGETLTAPASYPGTPWEALEEGDEQIDAFSSAIANCISTPPDRLPEAEQEACAAAQALMPPSDDIPVIDGATVAVVPQVTEIRFAEDHGFLGQAVVRPLTTDPRVTTDPDGQLLAEPFQVVAILDKGSVGLPSYMSLVLFVMYTAFHLWGLSRAERRKLSPYVT